VAPSHAYLYTAPLSSCATTTRVSIWRARASCTVFSLCAFPRAHYVLCTAAAARTCIAHAHCHLRACAAYDERVSSSAMGLSERCAARITCLTARTRYHASLHSTANSGIGRIHKCSLSLALRSAAQRWVDAARHTPRASGVVVTRMYEMLWRREHFGLGIKRKCA